MWGTLKKMSLKMACYRTPWRNKPGGSRSLEAGLGLNGFAALLLRAGLALSSRDQRGKALSHTLQKWTLAQRSVTHSRSSKQSGVASTGGRHPKGRQQAILDMRAHPELLPAVLGRPHHRKWREHSLDGPASRPQINSSPASPSIKWETKERRHN